MDDDLERELRERLSYRPGSKITPDNVGEFLLYRARQSAEVQLALVTALLVERWATPTSPFAKPADRDVLMALKVAAWGLCQDADIYEGRGPAVVPKHRAWQQIVEWLLTVLQPEPLSLSKKQLTRAKAVFRKLPEAIEVDGRMLEVKELVGRVILKFGEGFKDIEVDGHIERAQVDFIGWSAPRASHPGTNFTDYATRKLAAVMLLHDCEGTREGARRTVAEVLSYGASSDTKSLQKLEGRYRKAHRRSDANVPLENLPGFWLLRLGWHLMLLDDSLSDDLLRELWTIRRLLPEVPLVISWGDSSTEQIGRMRG